MKKIIIGLFVFFVVLVIAVPFLIPTKMISDKISSAAEDALHKKTVIQSVRISIFPRLGIHVSGLQIGTPKQDDFYVSLDSLFLELKWKPLFKKQVSISQISLTKPTIELYSTQTPPAPKEPASKSDTSGAELHIDSLLITDAAFTMFDPKMKPTVHVEGMSEKLSFDYSSNGTSTIDGETVIPVLLMTTPMGQLGRNTKIEIRKNIQVDANNLTIKELKIKLGSLPISLEGSVAGYSTETPNVDLKFSGGPSDIDNIIGLIPAGMLPSDLKDVESKGNLLIQGKLKGKINTKKAAESIQSSDFAIAINLSNGSIKAPQLPKPMSNIGFAINIDPKKAEVKNFNVDFGSSNINYSVLVNDYLNNPVFDFSTKSTLALTDVSALHQDLPAKDLKGSITMNIQASGAAKNPQSTVLNGLIAMNDISLDYPEMKYKVEHFNSNIKLASNNVIIQNLALLVNGSDFSGSGRIDNPMAMMNNDKNSLLKFAISIASKNLDADKLMPPPSNEESKPLPDSFYKLDGDIKATIQKLTFNKLAMTQAVGNVGIHKGLITFSPLSLHTFNGVVSLNGDVNLKNRNKPTFNLDTELKNIAVDKALAYADNINKLLKLDNSLKADIGLKAKSKGELTKDFDLNMNSLNSTGSFSLNNAVIQNHPIQKAFSKFFKGSQFDKISVKQWTQAFSVEAGKLNVNNLNFAAQNFSFNINGWQSLEGKNDFAIDAKLPPALTSKITDKLPGPIASLVGNQKQITLPFSVSGETASPTLGLNNDKLAGVAKDQLTSNVKTEAKQTLKKLVPGKKGAPKKDAIKKDAKDLKNKLKNLF